MARVILNRSEWRSIVSQFSRNRDSILFEISKCKKKTPAPRDMYALPEMWSVEHWKWFLTDVAPYLKNEKDPLIQDVVK